MDVIKLLYKHNNCNLFMAFIIRSSQIMVELQNKYNKCNFDNSHVSILNWKSWLLNYGFKWEVQKHMVFPLGNFKRSWLHEMILCHCKLINPHPLRNTYATVYTECSNDNICILCTLSVFLYIINMKINGGNTAFGTVLVNWYCLY